MPNIDIRKRIEDRFPSMSCDLKDQLTEFIISIAKEYANMSNEEMNDTIVKWVEETSASKEEVREIMREEMVTKDEFSSELNRIAELAGIARKGR